MASAAPAPIGPAGLAYAEAWAHEGAAADDVLAAAIHRADEMGVTAVDASVGAVLRMLAGALGARAVVEAGTGAGVSGLWLLGGMRPDGVLTTVDVEAEHQRAARQAFTEAGTPTNRFRLINGSAAEVLPRLTDRAYDALVVDADREGYPGYLEQAARLLRVGGVVAFVGVLSGDRITDSGQRDPATLALRELARLIRDDERFDAALLPVGDGLLLATRR
ncbi:O-methyltransferase [Jatrophihabitans sp. YIM 134969]